MENSKTYQYRKVMKPMLERKRRARINKCLDNLKDLMIECLTQEGEHIVRLEKADILELTVDYLKKQQQHKQHQQHNLETESMDSFRSGYIYAANEVSKTLASIPGVDISLGTTLMSHLGHRLNQVQPLITATLLQQQQQKRQQSNLMNPLKIDLESTATTTTTATTYRTEQTVASMHSSRTLDTMNYYNSNRVQTPISQISPASSGYHSDLPSPVSSESSFYDPRINMNISNNNSSSINNRNSISSCENMKTVCWRPW